MVFHFLRKKKKKKNKAEEIESQASTASPSSSRKNYSDEDSDHKEERIDTRTPAEIAFQKAQEKRVRLCHDPYQICVDSYGFNQLGCPLIEKIVYRSNLHIFPSICFV